MNKLPQRWKPEKVLAIEMLVMNPSMPKSKIADEIGVTRDAVYKWFKDPEFVEIFYEKYMISFGAKLPSVLQSMIKEAETGNVQAGRLVLEHSGKLIKRVEVKKHQSPFEKFLDNVEDAEFEVFPQRPEVPEIALTNREVSEKEKKEKQKQLRIVQKRKEARLWRERAMIARVPPLGSGRHTKTERESWYIKIIEAEKRIEKEGGYTQDVGGV